MAKPWPGPEYEIRATFRAPLDFVYRWCTDYTPQDGRYEKEEYDRRILRRSRRDVTFEDLYDTKDGWYWARHVVRLLPPNRWRSESVGSHSAYSLDYRLSALPGNRTQLTLRARRRPDGIGGKNPPKSQWERSVTASWRNFGRSLERDFRKTIGRRSRK
jgi:hypothetical protein